MTSATGRLMMIFFSTLNVFGIRAAITNREIISPAKI